MYIRAGFRPLLSQVLDLGGHIIVLVPSLDADSLSGRPVRIVYLPADVAAYVFQSSQPSGSPVVIVVYYCGGGSGGGSSGGGSSGSGSGSSSGSSGPSGSSGSSGSGGGSSSGGW